MVVLLGAAGCDRTARYPTRDVWTPAVDAGFGSLSATIGADTCPEVIMSLSPAEARIGAGVEVSAQVLRVDPGHTVSFAWSASAGSFAHASAAHTTFTCPGRDQAGPQTVSVTVSDGACEVTRALTVRCLALADGGGPLGTPSGDAGVNCADGDPTTCEGTLCNQCTTDSCDTVAGVSAHGGVATAGCDLYASVLAQKQCQDAYACMRDSGCVQNSNPLGCWCGTVDPELCESGAAPGNGPCLEPIFAAAGTRDPVLVETRLTDPGFPIGGAMGLATCRSVNCSGLSDPPNPACRL